MQNFRYVHIVLAIFLFSLNCNLVNGQSFQNVRVHQQGLQIFVNYDLFGQLSPETTVQFGYSIDNGKSYRRISDAIGDVDIYIEPGMNKEISWIILGKPISGEDVIFKVGTMEDFTPVGFVLVPGHKYRTGGKEPFYMSKFEITQKIYKEVTGTNPSEFKGASNPVESVSWVEAIQFCNQLSRLNGLNPCYKIRGGQVSCDWNANGYRLPTEAQWEYAAKSGGRSDQKWAGTNLAEKLSDYAWHSPNSKKTTHPVGTKLPNDLDLYDMSGNVWEWCWDQKNIQKDRLKGKSTNYYIIRGGGYFSYKYRSSDQDLVSTSSRTSSWGSGGSNIGFRIIGKNFQGIEFAQDDSYISSVNAQSIKQHGTESSAVKSYLPYRDYVKKYKLQLKNLSGPFGGRIKMGGINFEIFPAKTFYGVSISSGNSELSIPPYEVDESDTTDHGVPARTLGLDLDMVRFAIGTGGKGGWSNNLMLSESGEMLPYRWEIPFFLRYSAGLPLYLFQNVNIAKYNTSISCRVYIGLGYHGCSSRLVSKDHSILESQWNNSIFDQTELTVYILEYYTGISIGNINTTLSTGEEYNELYLRLQLALFN
jgi:formylglycine-generating enzyme